MSISPGASRDDGDLVNLAQRLGNRAHDFRHTRQQLIQHCCLVVFMECGGFNFHRISFGFTFGADDLCLCETFSLDNLGFGHTTCAVGFCIRQSTSFVSLGIADTACFGRVGLTLSLQENALSLGFRHRLNAPSLGLGRFLDRRLQLKLTALNFGLLHFNLRVLLNLGHFDRLGDHLLLHHVGLNIVGLVSGRLLLFYFGVKGGFFQGQVALRFRLESQRLGLSLDTLLIGGRFGNSSFSRGVRLLNLCVALSQRGGNIGLLANLYDLWAAHVGDVVVLIAYIFNRERDDFQAHLFHIRRDSLKHLRADVFWIFDQFFNRQLAHDTTQVTFHHQADQVLALVLSFTQELLRGSLDALFVRSHLDLRNCLDINRHSLRRIQILRRCHIKRHQFE